jgi:isoquinoline 1-oxidoreductase subunit alpha
MQLLINEKAYEIADEPDRPLLWVLRDELGLTGTKFGCGIGQCGSCTVQVDGAATKSCLTLVSKVQGKRIRTIEGLLAAGANGGEELHPVQQAFLEEQAPQCGWCMPGQMITAAALLESNPTPTEEQIREAMQVVYCRCGTYHRIRKAVARAAKISSANQQDAARAAKITSASQEGVA